MSKIGHDLVKDNIELVGELLFLEFDTKEGQPPTLVSTTIDSFFVEDLRKGLVSLSIWSVHKHLVMGCDDVLLQVLHKRAVDVLVTRYIILSMRRDGILTPSRFWKSLLIRGRLATIKQSNNRNLSSY